MSIDAIGCHSHEVDSCGHWKCKALLSGTALLWR